MCRTICFLWTMHGSTWVDSLIVQRAEYGVLKTHRQCRKPSAFVTDWYWVRTLSTTNCGPLSFEDTITAENYPDLLTQFLALLEENKQVWWFQQNGASSHTTKASTASSQNFFGDRIVGRGLWPPRSPDLTSPDFCCADFLKKECTAITQDAWRTFNTILKRLLPALSKQLFDKLQQKNAVKGWMLVFKGVGEIFSIWCNYTLLITLMVFLKK